MTFAPLLPPPPPDQRDNPRENGPTPSISRQPADAGWRNGREIRNGNQKLPPSYVVTAAALKGPSAALTTPNFPIVNRATLSLSLVLFLVEFRRPIFTSLRSRRPSRGTSYIPTLARFLRTFEETWRKLFEFAPFDLIMPLMRKKGSLGRYFPYLPSPSPLPSLRSPGPS